MPHIDLDRLLQIVTTFPSFFAAVAAAFAYFSSRRNHRLARETKFQVDRVEIKLNGHLEERIAVERKAARAEGVAEVRQAVVEAENALLRSDQPRGSDGGGLT